ncbi:hypothetical protein EZS27_004710 [termite gut metagenome]|uniref:Uncharacterized protein n=1 Tax=termite gut metagenome TaxID=433724 RepID=A0A5J4SRW0_9ZZZZ
MQPNTAQKYGAMDALARSLHEQIINSLPVGCAKEEKQYILYYVYSHLKKDIVALEGTGTEKNK